MKTRCRRIRVERGMLYQFFKFEFPNPIGKILSPQVKCKIHRSDRILLEKSIEKIYRTDKLWPECKMSFFVLWYLHMDLNQGRRSLGLINQVGVAIRPVHYVVVDNWCNIM